MDNEMIFTLLLGYFSGFEENVLPFIQQPYVLTHKQYYQLPSLAAKWSGAYELFPKIYKEDIQK